MMIPIWENEVPYFDTSLRQFPASISPYLLDGENNACCLVIPGGGYAKKAWDHEGVQIAEWLNSIGMSAFVLDYRIEPYDGKAYLADGQQALRYIRKNAEKFGLDRNRIGVCGFSAGGHLAASCATLYKDETVRPDFALLCYAVLTLGEGTHKGTSENFLGKEKHDPAAQAKWSPINNVKADCPPTFLWTTDTDVTVPPVPNTYAMFEACKKAGVDVEMISFDHGPHGLGIPKDDPEIASWAKVCEKWLKKRNFI